MAGVSNSDKVGWSVSLVGCSGLKDEEKKLLMESLQHKIKCNTATKSLNVGLSNA